MDIYDVIKTRKSVRAYLDKTVERDKIDRIFNAVRLAPSAGNYQEWRFVLVSESSKKSRIAETAPGKAFIAEAPIVVVCCAETNHHVMKCGLECFPIDVAIAIDHLTLAAAAEGLGTCWIGGFDAPAVKKIIDIPLEIEVVELLLLGYPADSQPREKSRKALAEIVRWEKW